jgi:hypothetical protein
MQAHKTEISIWFFIGSLLACYGVLIMAAGVWEWLYPPARPPVLHELRPSLWWGAVLILIGAIYCARYRPRKES